MNVNELTSQLLALYEGGRTFDFLANGARVLASNDQLAPVAVLMLQGLVQLQLGGPARELFRSRAELCESNDAQQIRDVLQRIPDGRRPWSVARVLFKRNRDALVQRNPSLANLLDALPARLADYEMHRTACGDLLLSSCFTGRLRQWRYLISASDADEELPLPPRGQLDPVVIIGVRIGTLLERVTAATSRLILSYSHPIFVAESDLTRLAAWLHAEDHTRYIRDPRVYWFFGDDAGRRLQAHLASQVRAPLPTFFVNQTGDAQAGIPIQQNVELVVADRAQRLAEAETELKRRYADRDAAYWARRYESPGTVLAVTSRFTTMLQYSMRDAIAAMRRMGWRSQVMIEQSNHEQFSSLEYCEKILELDPDLLVLIDHLRYENPYLPANLPMLSWIQDPLANLLNPQAGASIGPFDFVCGYYKDRCTQEFGYPPEQFCSTVLPVCETVFHDAPLIAKDQHTYGCDVSFVSNASRSPLGCLEDALAECGTERQPLLRSIYQQVMGALERGEFISQYVGAPAIVRQAAKRLNVQPTDQEVEELTQLFAYRIFDWGRRQQSLEWVARWAETNHRTLRIYGRGWRNHPTLAAHAAGVIEHGEPLRKTNRASRLALQLIPSGYRHQRTFELLACGTLPLTRYCPSDFSGLTINEFVDRRDAGGELDDASRFFPGMERVVFNSAAEFESLAHRLLIDDDYRNEVLVDLRDVVLERCTYGAVMRRVTQFIRNRLAHQARTGHNPQQSDAILMAP